MIFKTKALTNGGAKALAMLLMAVTPSHAMHASPANTAKQNPAQCEKTQRLPERDLMQAEQLRHQPVPQPLHHHAAECLFLRPVP